MSEHCDCVNCASFWHLVEAGRQLANLRDDLICEMLRKGKYGWPLKIPDWPKQPACLKRGTP